MSVLFIVLVFVVSSSVDGFLLEGSTASASHQHDQYLTYAHYVHLHEELLEEKHARQQLEQVVVQLQAAIGQLTNQNNPQVNLTAAIEPYSLQVQRLERDIAALESTVNSLQNDKHVLLYNLKSVEQNYTVLCQQLETLQNEHNVITGELNTLKSVKNFDAALTLKQTTAEVVQLQANEAARRQDFMALYNMTLSSKHELDILKNDSNKNDQDAFLRMGFLENTVDMMKNETSQKFAVIDQADQDAFSRMGFLGNTVDMLRNETSQKFAVLDQTDHDVATKIGLLENNLNILNDNTSQMFSDITQNVGFTVCWATMRSDETVEFAYVKSSHGLNMDTSYKDGRFIAPFQGFYFITWNIMTNTSTEYHLNKNGVVVSWSLGKWQADTFGYFHTASSSGFLHLVKGDIITLTGKYADHASCMTIFKF